MSHEIDERTLTDEQWEIMFSGPEWDERTIEALSCCLPKAYEIHAQRVKSVTPLSAETEPEEQSNDARDH